jgi:hypothetical protein
MPITLKHPPADSGKPPEQSEGDDDPRAGLFSAVVDGSPYAVWGRDPGCEEHRAAEHFETRPRAASSNASCRPIAGRPDAISATPV